MIDAFTQLARGRPELTRWFELAHCGRCGKFTAVPYFLGCDENHTFCGQCVLVQMKVVGRVCPECNHAFSRPDSVIFRPHAAALVMLLHARLPIEGSALAARLALEEPQEQLLEELTSAVSEGRRHS